MKVYYQSENDYIILLNMSNSEPLYTTLSILSNFLNAHNNTFFLNRFPVTPIILKRLVTC